MVHRIFRKEDFRQDETGIYILEVPKEIVGIGASLIIERQTADGEYEIVQADIHRHNDDVLIKWSEPFDGRLLYDE
ncbi:glutathione synthase [uncultured Chryseobacterium sp.]|uniref:glutathione synthase n=1 Tax=uncultured Chryseobacterium sp. TaxID=259322 RepID=UPI0025DCB0D5|nr:glutathione synthase [uncultured Chryseobacterium sp.]